ncbi:protein translocase subunit SecD [Tindallia californiensis]|uniref:Protein translocase subunit SecD n=1 Tax=Tindallia californiensis TaxID=159292 RepID=A0A1H3NED3_9FIRM|nr:protein translocase subunit SecD [Tindallia californiensis]SDY87291.1 preprotein translocase subunit SecD/SecD/SecF fusion protein [Tindallia californiensis]
MKAKYILIFLMIMFIAIAGVFTAINGLSIGERQISPVSESINQGLDLRGGVFVIYEADTDASGEELDKIIEQTISVFRMRVDGMGLTEPVIVREGENRIRVELPGVEEVQEALDMIGRTAQLEFLTPNEQIVLTGGNVTGANATYVDGEANPVVRLELDNEGAKSFADATGTYIGEPIYIILDDEIISAPVVRSRIPDGVATISGNFTIEEASNLAALIRAGSLPVNLNEVQTSTITATLGVDALNRSIDAAKIGIALVLLFMLVVYRLPGFVANIALTIYILLVLGIFISLNATLTLPGIAALILSIGMAVDANVIIFERVKEEIANGKTIRVSIDSGFKRAFTTILDANITTLIAGITLYQFGTGPIRGFAVMLMIGLAVSMFTAMVVTRVLLKSLVATNLFKNPKYFGA